MRLRVTMALTWRGTGTKSSFLDEVTASADDALSLDIVINSLKLWLRRERQLIVFTSALTRAALARFHLMCSGLASSNLQRLLRRTHLGCSDRRSLLARRACSFASASQSIVSPSSAFAKLAFSSVIVPPATIAARIAASLSADATAAAS